MSLREGLSFSDYIDDSIPYEVKPLPPVMPTCEDDDSLKNYGQDYPLRAKDLFKGLWEGDQYIDPNAIAFWVDPHGKFHSTKSHNGWAKAYLARNTKQIPGFETEIYDAMYRLGFIRLQVNEGDEQIMMDYGTKGSFIGNPNRKQHSEILNYAIEKQYSLYDDTRHHYVKLLESVLNEDVLKYGADYWLDVNGRFIRAHDGHSLEAGVQLAKRNIPFNDEDDYSEEHDNEGVYFKMYELGFYRVKIENDTLFANNHVKPPTNIQMRVLKDSAIESDLKLWVNKKTVDLYENVKTDNRTLFIESMMPNNIDEFKSHLIELFAYLKKELQLKTIPSVKLVTDEKNASKILGRTAYYDPEKKLVALYITDRHQKDILRSFAHEIIHHWQHENEKLTSHQAANEGKGAKDPQYAQNNPWLRQMEKQAYLLGNIMFRDWEDQKKAKDKKSNKKMAERTYLLGKSYPPKKPDYSG